RDISHFEIALRNSYDMAIAKHWNGKAHWLLDPDSPAVTPIWRIKKDRSGLKRGSDVNYPNRRAVDAAIRQCGGRHAAPGKVMAELSFGFWRYLTSAPREKSLWVPYVHDAYPPKTKRSYVDHAIGTIHAVRNRVAHHEPLFDRSKTPEQEPVQMHASLIRVLEMLAPDVATHVASSSTVATVLDDRP